jgi:hypothetical protein
MLTTASFFLWLCILIIKVHFFSCPIPFFIEEIRNSSSVEFRFRMLCWGERRRTGLRSALLQLLVIEQYEINKNERAEGEADEQIDRLRK